MVELTDGSMLGPEQRVTRAEGMDINKPVAFRRPDGKVQRSFAVVTGRDPQGWVNAQGLRSVVLDSDAPASG